MNDGNTLGHASGSELVSEPEADSDRVGLEKQTSGSLPHGQVMRLGAINLSVSCYLFEPGINADPVAAEAV